MKIKNSIWKHWYECDCHEEGIMMSYENIDNDDYPYLELAFFKMGKVTSNISFFERLRWCLHILIHGYPYIDYVMLRQQTAKNLGKDLLEFANKKFINKKNEKKV